MVFTGSFFLFVFFPVSLGAYYLSVCLQKKIRLFERLRLSDWALVAVSLVFYGWTAWDGIAWLIGYVFLVYLLGRVIAGMPGKTAAGLLATLCCVLTVGLTLLYFKYYNFAVTNLNRLFGSEISLLSLAAPLGISFITFSAISYFVDIYRRDAKPGSFLDTALYLTFFPKVISGPIVLWKDFSKNLMRENRKADSSRILWGINRMIVGFSKKVILADTLGALVAQIQSNAAVGIDLPTAWGAAFCYMLQIYYDFAGYSDIALGLVAMFGFSFEENFCFPYCSCSITEFWRRWHISLGRWFREYLYIPLGGNRKGKNRTLCNLFIVFLVTGFWHGAGWNYILWGVVNGICIVAERCVRDKSWYQKIPKVIKWAATMLIVLFSWQIFRLNGMSEIARYFGMMTGIVRCETIDFTWQYYFDGRIILLMLIGTVGATLFHSQKLKAAVEKAQKNPVLFCIMQLGLFALGILSVMFMVNSTYSPFIYFQY